MRRSLDVMSVLSSDDLSDYDVISDGHQSLESSIADLGHVAGGAATLREPAPLPAAQERFDTIALTADDIQDYVQKAVPAAAPAFKRGSDGELRTVRVYVDGVFDPFQARDALQLRQAKLSFPSVHLMVGVLADDLCEAHHTPIIWPHVDRCEVLRHCRWVDEIVPEAPWTLDEQFLRAKRVDYVAVDEGSSVSPACDKERLKGYDLVKSLRKSIPTRRTNTMTPVEPRGLSVFTESTKGTMRGPADLAAALQQKLSVDDDTDTNPFEEPKQDIFGIGYGV
ncbi:uncharacterized protein C8Q71DRAFT_795133 [Rhodofomes roseus]|uniref:choline-phosphate cytidylyltransferase n=1 Tax=Rhodofomes roseus TaxID=34475 RepID=A0ABQ8KNA7_9APHY|nr:uncharacterized protein C8Q71DRAFT_795133 [Rhodofomes roseus]KAH9839880.1 hypothetical protein C8Q71DRAFT_795133 [Rhodofomes roseus]